jgi:protein SCO1
MTAAIVTLTLQLASAPAAAGMRPQPGVVSSNVPAPLRDVGFDQNLDQRIPLDVPFRDETGRPVMLREYFGARPVVLVFAYYQCPMLCSLVINGLDSTLKTISLKSGADFDVVVISFDPRDTTAAAADRKRHFHAGAHFLTGDQSSIETVTTAAGFRYVWDAQTSQFAHPSGVIVLTPDGRLARYLFGVEYSPRSLRLAIVEASGGKVGNPADTLLLYCYHYDPITGRYGLAIMRALRIAGAGTVLALVTFIGVMLRRERR